MWSEKREKEKKRKISEKKNEIENGKKEKILLKNF